MSISNGQIANQNSFNNAFLSRTVDTSMTGRLTNNNVTESMDESTGAIVTQGGIGALGNINAGGSIGATGDILSNGSFSFVSGTRAAPLEITDASGITFSGYAEEIQFIQGSGGAVNIVANPQISAGTVIGQKITLIGRSDTNTVTLDNGDGLEMNGPCTLGESAVIRFIWDGTFWVEEYRNGMA